MCPQACDRDRVTRRSPGVRLVLVDEAEDADMLNSVLHSLLSLHGWPAYAIVGALCFGEAAIFLGFVIPGETAVVYGGVLASQHHVSLVAMGVVVVASAILGDTVGYVVGRFFGPVLLEHRPLKGSKGVERTRAFIQRRGGPAVFLGRFVSLFRALAPGMAGLSELRYRTFFFFNALGGIVWGVGFMLAGYFVGESVLKTASKASWAVLALLVLLLTFVLYRKVREHRQQASPGTTPPKPD
jgi:membrane protein DedA with SNARE-associated domain